MIAKTGALTPDLFRFLKDLRTHNKRDWFQKNKSRYEESARDPFLKLITELRPGLSRISPHFVVDPAPSGGSMMRIYRDIRFAKDKSPYKTSIAAHFWHGHGKEGMTPGFYLHLEPDESLAGGGLWRPPPEGLKVIRDAIVARPGEWKKVVTGRSFQSACGMAGESLKRPPAGYDPAHPFIEDLKRKDFATSIALSEKDLVGPDPVRVVLGAFQTITPFLRFITEALGLPF
jgi:uncharacterized protein (TIGR02453 family)